jgi:hypothetical protein
MSMETYKAVTTTPVSDRQTILRAMNAARDAWSLEHGHTEHDTGAWVLHELDQSYLEGMDAMIEAATSAVPETKFGNMDDLVKALQHVMLRPELLHEHTAELCRAALAKAGA